MNKITKIRLAVVLVCFLLAVVMLQWHGNAYSAEFGDNSDEASHYVTGLMVRDYIAQGFPEAPLAFARNYYVHYPKVALGHWPPFFYMVQAVWTLVVPPCRISILLLMAIITASLAALMTESLRGEVSAALRYGAAALFLSLPVIVRFSRSVMAELLVALLVFLAVMAYAKYLDTERWQPAVWFGVFFALALLTKGTGIQLALVPPLGILLRGKIYLITRVTFWLPVLVVGLIAGPWYKWVPGAQHESVARFGGIGFETTRFMGSLEAFYGMLGIVLTLAAILGVCVSFPRMRKEGGGLWATGLAVLVGAYVARLSIGAYEERHLLVNLPQLVLFAVLGVDWLLRRPLVAPQWRVVPAAVLVLGLVTFNLYGSPNKRYFGYSDLAENLLSRADFKHSAVLICSTSEGEGMMISEVAMREARPGHFILRAYKMLASSDWMGLEYHAMFHDSKETMAWVESVPAGFVVIDGGGRKTVHGKMLYEGLKAHPDTWEHMALGTSDIQVFRMIGQETRPVQSFHIPMHNGLYGTFSN